ncbi:universal stress protein UspA [Dictyobacter alpinus]|uniref:Universal stress protein UspA n=1 Tax=Dictyobacter alpinus TaxID=2014873 RepID=A0A402BFN7_9CHLR|nr:universal stress protein [Dictyobacter alpinus]GCE30156.1 universal stress protein UspA [Dictyobacter alpinus]
MNGQFQHIIVPLDGSVCAEHALPLAARLARASGARITLLYILEYIPEYVSSPVPATMVSQESMAISEKQARDYLVRIQKSPVLSGLALHPDLFYGRPAATIVENASLEHADLIVMCSHGRTGFKRFVMGSVAQQVAIHSPVPVLILQRSDKEEIEELAVPFRILVALDGSERSEAILKPAAMLSVLLSTPQTGNLHLLRVVPPVHATDMDEIEATTHANRQALKDAKKYLKDLSEKLRLDTLRELPVQISYSVRYDKDVSGAVYDAAMVGNILATPAISAIALTTHGRHGIPRLLLGSVTEDILRHATLPLLVVRHPDKKVETQGATEEKQAPAVKQEKTYSPFIAF